MASKKVPVRWGFRTSVTEGIGLNVLDELMLFGEAQGRSP